MSEFARFMKQYKKQRENTVFPVTKSLIDENGNTVLWSIKPLSTKENDIIRDDCTIDLPIKGKPNTYRQKLDTSKYIARMMVASIVYPNLNDKELQDSYGVMCAEDLLKEIVDDPGEYAEFAQFIQTFNGFTSFEDKVETAKN